MKRFIKAVSSQQQSDSVDEQLEKTGKSTSRSSIANIVALSAAHFSCDAHLNFLPPLWPMIKSLYRLNNTHIGLLTAMLSITANFGQVVFGYLTDRLRPPRLVLIGVVMTSGFISTIGFMPSLTGVIFFLLMAGLGIALFHPKAAALATGWSSHQAAFGLAIFGSSGTSGYAMGSLIGVFLYQQFGSLSGLLPALGFGLTVAITVAIIDPEDDDKKTKVTFGLRRHLLPRIGQISPIFAIITMRTAAITVFVNFIPLLLRTRGTSLAAGGSAVFLFLAGTSIGGLVGGKLGDVWDERRLTIISLLLASPLLLISVIANGITTFICLFLAGFMLRCADYVNIAQAQAVVPEGASMAASLGMGATWGIAGLVAPLVGRLADLYGEVYALALSAGLPVLGALIAFTLTKFERY